MRFLWIARENPLNPDGGLTLYSNGLLRSLLGCDTSGALIGYYRREADGVIVPKLDVVALTWRPKLRLFSILSHLNGDSYRLRTTPYATKLTELLLVKPDTVFIDYYSMGWVLPIIDRLVFAGQIPRPLLVYIAHNHESTLRTEVANSMASPLMRYVLRQDARKAALLEAKLVSACDLLITITDRDKCGFKAQRPTIAAITLPPGYDKPILPTRPITEAVPRRAVILGNFEWVAKQANLRRFLECAAPWFTRQNIALRIIGKVPAKTAKDISCRYAFCELTGRVPAVRPLLNDARIGIMSDDVGGGFKIKYLDYVFSGLAIATIRSQTAGLPVDIDRDLIATESLEELARSVALQMDDVALLEGMRRQCLDACIKEFNWQDRGERLYAAINKLRNGLL